MIYIFVSNSTNGTRRLQAGQPVSEATVTKDPAVFSAMHRCIADAYADSTEERVQRWLSKLVEVVPDCLPMDTPYKVAKATMKLMIDPQRARSAIPDFKRAVKMWHVTNHCAAPPLFESDWAKLYFIGLAKNLPAQKPMHAHVDEWAEHGHQALPPDVLLKLCQHWDTVGTLAAKRDCMIAILLFAATRRYDEVYRMRIEDLRLQDTRGAGIDWHIPRSKTDRLRVGFNVYLPESTSSGLGIAARLRTFLREAPQDGGYVFRPTTKEAGAAGTIQEWQGPVRSKKGRVSWLMYTGSAWNQNFRRAMAIAAPDVNASLYSAHALRAGGVTSAINNGATMAEGSTMLNHKSPASIIAYFKPAPEAKRALFERTIV
jgi:hypothetical protein